MQELENFANLVNKHYEVEKKKTTRMHWSDMKVYIGKQLNMTDAMYEHARLAAICEMKGAA